MPRRTTCGHAFGVGPALRPSGTVVSKSKRGQSRAHQPSENELQRQRTRHGCRKYAANVVEKLVHGFLLFTRRPSFAGLRSMLHRISPTFLMTVSLRMRNATVRNRALVDARADLVLWTLLWRILLSVTEGSQNGAREPFEDRFSARDLGMGVARVRQISSTSFAMFLLGPLVERTPKTRGEVWVNE